VLMVHQAPGSLRLARAVVVAYCGAHRGEAGRRLPLMLYLRKRRQSASTPSEKLCKLPGVAGVKWACPHADAPRGSDPPLRPGRSLWVDGLAEPWAPPFFAVGGARLHLRAHQTSGPSHSMAIHGRHSRRADYALARKLIDVMAGFEDPARRGAERQPTVTVVERPRCSSWARIAGARPPPAFGPWPLTETQIPKLKKQLEAWGQSRARAPAPKVPRVSQAKRKDARGAFASARPGFAARRPAPPSGHRSRP